MGTPVSVTPPQSEPERLPAHCGSCGRFVGPYARCPYCGAQITGRIAVRTLKLVVIVLVTLGLALLWWLARQADVPTVTVGQATSTMNLAYVRVHGRVTRGLTYDPESGYLGFWLADDTGELHVNSYRDVTETLLARDRLPALGDEITVAGTLRVRDDFLALTVNVPEHLVLRRPDAVPVQAGAITVLDEGRRVQVAGEVVEVWRPYEGLTLVSVGDDSGTIAVAVDDVVTTLTGALPEMQPGQGIDVTGNVSLYRGSPQLALADVGDIRLAAAPPTPTPVTAVPLGQLDAGDAGQQLLVRGRIVALDGLSGGVKGTLDDGSAQVTLLLWDRVHQALSDPVALDVGAEVEVLGEVAVYEGALEIVPAFGEDVVILQPAPAPPWVEVAALSVADVGRVIRVRGVLGDLEGFSAGVKTPLDDGTGAIEVVFWENLFATLAPTPEAGQQVEITGVLDVYRQALQLIPRSAFDWRVRPSDD